MSPDDMLIGDIILQQGEFDKALSPPRELLWCTKNLWLSIPSPTVINQLSIIRGFTHYLISIGRRVITFGCFSFGQDVQSKVLLSRAHSPKSKDVLLWKYCPRQKRLELILPNRQMLLPRLIVSVHHPRQSIAQMHDQFW